jgi:hypothetical protein
MEQGGQLVTDPVNCLWSSDSTQFSPELFVAQKIVRDINYRRDTMLLLLVCMANKST